ncbi:MerR family transcriptional regulator [Marinobacterium zhoushanense]|uniref:Mercuric resistance operon regulatory protein n=1 Tax=Marinobacterium zhoushanense TaxID=1679163 RepID=A0ABQ1K9K0_9GAMM|nr:Hg(II)-responsive transcriptional regulator [Marinobacterium zhoushanense]GGB91147.1 MerR family transcriptional regulator [Marinobacterium zhoushanense]
MSDLLSIGQLAKSADVNVETIRYYQRRGLLTEPPKPQYGYRRYPIEHVERLRFIKRAQALGFTLSEIDELLALDNSNRCANTQEMATRKLALIERKMADLASMQQALAGLIQQCDAESGTDCPIIQALSRG